ncbi:MAG: hypothetical protein RL092_1293 [Bacteroidota bacterium]|jgi:hypothetical protein
MKRFVLFFILIEALISLPIRAQFVANRRYVNVYGSYSLLSKMIDQTKLRAQSENLATSYFGGVGAGIDFSMSGENRRRVNWILGFSFNQESVNITAKNYAYRDTGNDLIIEPDFKWNIKKQAAVGRLLFVYQFSDFGLRFKPLFGFKKSKVWSYSGFTVSKNWFQSDVSTLDPTFNPDNFARSKYSGQIVLLGLSGIFGSSENVGLNCEFALGSPYVVRGGLVFGF